MAFDEAGPKDHTPPPPPGTVGAGGAGGAVPLSGVDDTSLGGIHFVRAAAPTREAVHAALAAQGIESGDWGVTRTDGSEDPARLMATAKGAGDSSVALSKADMATSDKPVGAFRIWEDDDASNAVQAATTAAGVLRVVETAVGAAVSEDAIPAMVNGRLIDRLRDRFDDLTGPVSRMILKRAVAAIVEAVENEADTYEGCNELTEAGCFERLDLLQVPVIGMEKCRPLRYLADVLAFADAFRVFANVFEDVTTEIASAAAAKDIVGVRAGEHAGAGADEDSWTYGEIEFFAFAQLLDDIVASLPDSGAAAFGAGAFCDLGSGSGKAVVAAALTQPLAFSAWRGVESLPSLNELASGAIERLRVMQAESTSEEAPIPVGGAAVPSELGGSRISVEAGDLRVPLGAAGAVDLSDVSVAFCHTTMFDTALLAGVTALTKAMPKGALVVSASRPLDGASHLELLLEVEADMTWGSGTLYLHRVV